MSKIRSWQFASLVICAVLYLLWPTAHTIAARKLLLLLGAGIGVVLWIKSEDRYTILKSPWLIFLGLLLAWVVFHAAFISQNGGEAWTELRGQWLPAYLAVLAGIGLALASRSMDSSVFRNYLLVILSAQAVLYVLVSVFKGIQDGHLAIGYWGEKDVRLGTDLKTSLTINAELMAALSCAMFLESVKAARDTKKYTWLLPVAVALYVAILTGSLNAILLICASILVVATMLAYQFRANIHRAHAIVLILIASASIYAVVSTPAVHSNLERAFSNVRLAVDVDDHPYWKFYSDSVPINSMGEPAPVSFYHRIARAIIGARLALQHPLGYGVTRHAFQEQVQQKYPDAKMIGSSENGYINIVSAVGFPALALFLLAVFSVYRKLLDSASQWKRPVVWMMGISLAHLALDAIERDHFFEIYLFLIALTATLLTKVGSPEHANSGNPSSRRHDTRN